ncbi:unnamed protein product [Mytilus coruscus]|uniref:Mutator-like transposase domain-containing protein n=1 Tax=Mytilus coruscus TaxID=42192 RepID=A0A6J8BGA8_MYTCO|nr:unnamed protein product [Mytilus coruscus]
MDWLQHFKPAALVVSRSFHLTQVQGLKQNASRHFDVNVRAVWGALASGNGLAHLNEVLATLDSPTMSQNTFTTIENEISQWWKDLLQEDFSQAIAEEKKIAIAKGNFHEEHDITNCINHIYGDHSRCSDFCKANLKDKSSVQAIDDNDDTENIFDEQCCFWNEGTSNDALEESRLSSDLSITDLMSCMRQDLSLILSRVAKKSTSLLGNFTSNLAEMWMHVRTKYDGGIQWSPQTWEETTSSVSGHYFTNLYSKRLQCLKNNTKTKGKKEIKTRRYKRKIKSAKESTAASSKKHYGPEAIQVEADISSEELDKRKQQYLKKHIEISHSEIDDIEINTRLQGSCKRWRDERATRLTASNFGLIFKRNPKIPVTPLLNQLLNSKFYGNSATRHGLSEERITIKEYIQYKLKTKCSCHHLTWKTSLQLVLHTINLGKRKSDQNLDSCLSNISPAASNTVTLKRSRRKCSSLKFVGRRISHEWIEDDGTSKWYKGTVTAVIDKNDGDEDAEYEVHYENHKEANIVDHLNEDFKKGSLKFIDI